MFAKRSKFGLVVGKKFLQIEHFKETLISFLFKFQLPHRDSEASFPVQSVHQSRLKSRSKQSVNQRSRSSSKSGSRSRDGASM